MLGVLSSIKGFSQKDQVDIIEGASIEQTSKAIISCGAGSSYLLNLRNKK